MMKYILTLSLTFVFLISIAAPIPLQKSWHLAPNSRLNQTADSLIETDSGNIEPEAIATLNGIQVNQIYQKVAQILIWASLMPVLLTACSELDLSQFVKFESKFSFKEATTVAPIDELSKEIRDGLKETPITINSIPAFIALKEDQRRFSIEQSPLNKEAIADLLNYQGQAREIFLNYGIVTEGSNEKNLFKIKEFLRQSLPEHYSNFHSFISRNHSDTEEFGGFYYHLKKGVIFFYRHAIEKTVGEIDSLLLAHEIGHNVYFNTSLLSEAQRNQYRQLFNQSSDQNAFVTGYAMTHPKEDFAEVYSFWRTESLSLPFLGLNNNILGEKILIVAKTFTFTKNGRLYIRIFRNETYFDLPLNLPNNDLDLLTIDDLFALKNPFPSTELTPAAIADKTIYFYSRRDPDRSALLLKNDLMSLKQNNKITTIFQTIYKLKGSFKEKAKKTLLRLNELTQTDPIISFNPDQIHSLNQLEGFLYLDPQGLLNWAIQDSEQTAQKIKSLAPYYESFKQPASPFMALLRFYEEYLSQPNPSEDVREKIIVDYNLKRIKSYDAYSTYAFIEFNFFEEVVQAWDPSTGIIAPPLQTGDTTSTDEREPIDEILDHLDNLRENNQTNSDVQSNTSNNSIQNQPPLFQSIWALPLESGSSSSIGTSI